jgi:hypothetical protein
MLRTLVGRTKLEDVIWLRLVLSDWYVHMLRKVAIVRELSADVYGVTSQETLTLSRNTY